VTILAAGRATLELVNPVGLGKIRFGPLPALPVVSGDELAEGAVRPGRVVVPQVLGYRFSQVALVDDQQPV
jgi:hypothetical protein